jgi:surface polysaccharide O-acyltransferase-like enzyme
MRERIKSIDSLRGFAILAVVLIHTTTRTLEASGFNISEFSWTLFLNQTARFAVPLFFVMSGFVLEYSYHEEFDYWSFVKRRFSKIFVPYVFWSLFYYIFIYNQNHDNFLRVILTGNASYQLYFIPTLCIFYLLFPFLHKIYKFISHWFVMMLILGSQIYLLYLDYFVKEFDFSDPIHIAILAYFFFIIGMVGGRNKDKIADFVKKWKSVILASALVLGFYVFWQGRGGYLTTGSYLSYYSQWRPSILVYTILVGLSCYYLFENTKLRDSIINKFSRHSFLVFFVHVVVLEGLWAFVGKSLFAILSQNILGKIVFDPLFFGTTAFISFAIAFALHKISGIVQLIG